MLRLVAIAAFAVLSVGGNAAAQTVRTPPGRDVQEVADSSDLLSAARRAQATFERRRIRFLPLARQAYGASCDENVGRFCSWYEEGDWHPEPEPPEVVELRDELLRALDSLAAEVPGDDWILGQRVWYRAEAGQWAEGLNAARECNGAAPWWCAALEGFSRHGLGQFEASLSAFERALALMGREEAERWRVPRWPVDGNTRGYLEDLSTDSLDLALARLWALADPLFLVAGNDRLTEHYARWTFAQIRRRARNPFQISWGRDLDQLTVRHGWEAGWEREWSRNVFSRDNVVGHKHPEGRDFMPSGAALQDPQTASIRDLRADRSRPRSLYAAPYAPILLPAEGQVAVFPRGSEVVVVATHFLPPDTTFDYAHEHPRPWLEPGNQAGRAEEAGLFLLPEAGLGLLSRRVRGSSEGALLIRAPAGGYVLSVETWSPPLRRAGRHRVGIRADTVPEDVATLSDILLVRGGGDDPGSLEGALDRVMVEPRVGPGQPLGIVFEVAGLGWRPEILAFELSVERTGRGMLRRAGEFLGLVGRDRPLSLGWEEPAPEEPAPLFRWLNLDLPVVDPGEYEIKLELSVAGRGGLSSVRRFVIEG